VADGVVELQTHVPGLVLREHTAKDAGPYYDLVQANRAHLTRHGDYTELVASTRDGTERRFANPQRPSVRCGIWKDDRLIGHVTLVHAEPPRWGVGFWLSEHASGQGFMTAALAALLDYARTELNAAEVLAGVTQGNHRSAAVLTRLGFAPITHFPTYTRYQLVLA
jgi:RimJ/RimL family protein N-acetyltransferase